MKSLMTILVAEDDADDRFLLQAAFTEAKLNVDLKFEENGLDVLAYLENIKDGVDYPHLMLLDLNMPKKSGREVLKQVKSDINFKNIPVIIFSTTNNRKEIDNCYALGATQYIIKPDNFSDLLNVVNDIHSKCAYVKSVSA